MMMSGKRLLEKPRFELTAKGVFRLGKHYILWAITSFGPASWKDRLPTVVDRLIVGTVRRQMQVSKLVTRTINVPQNIRYNCTGRY